MAGTQRHPDWDEQRGRLSAYLDGELSAEEARELEAHLPTCADCQQALASLRSVRDLLGALPAVRAPRSFALPLDTSHTTVRPVAVRQTRPVWYPVTQWAGGIAACLGLLLVVGSTLLGGLPHGALTGASGVAAPGLDSRPTNAPYAGTAQTPGTNQQNDLSHPATTTPGASPSPKIGLSSSPPPSYSNLNNSASSPPTAAIAGLGLVVAGLATAVLGRRARPRAA